MDQPIEQTPVDPPAMLAEPVGPDEIQERLWGLGESPLGFHGKRPLRPATLPVRPRPQAELAAEERETERVEQAAAVARLDGHVQNLARQLERSVRRLLALEARVADGLTTMERRLDALADQASPGLAPVADLEPLADALSAQVTALGESLAHANAVLAARIVALEEAVGGAGGLADRLEELDRTGGAEANLAAAERLEAVGHMLVEAEERLAGLATAQPAQAAGRIDDVDRRLMDLERAHAALASSVERGGRELSNRLTRRLEDVRDDLAVQIAESRRSAAAARGQAGAPDPALVERLRAAEDAFAERARSVAEVLARPPGTAPPADGVGTFREAVQDLIRLHRDVRRSLESLGNPRETPET